MYANTLIGVYGLIFDITGAWFISRGLVKKTDEQIIKESRTVYGGNFANIESNAYQKVECTIGFILMAVGFILQAVGYFIEGDNIAQTWLIALLVGMYVIIIGVCILLNIRIRGKYYKMLAKKFEERKQKK